MVRFLFTNAPLMHVYNTIWKFDTCQHEVMYNPGDMIRYGRTSMTLSQEIYKSLTFNTPVIILVSPIGNLLSKKRVLPQ